MSYLWIIYSLISAFSLATSDALTKKALTEQNEYIVAWLRLLFSVPLLVAVVLFTGVPALDGKFYKAFATALPFEVIAFILYIKALRVSPLGLTLPFLAFTPVFLIGVSYLVAGERVSITGAAGILMIASGSYVLNFHHIGRDVFKPFRALAKERGSLMMLGVAAIYSITSSLGKVAITHSSPLFFGALYYIVFSLVFTPFAIPQMKKFSMEKFLMSRADLKAMLLIGALNSVMVISHMLGMSLGKVAYMIAVKRTSLLIGVLYGYFFFREGHIRERLAGALLMFAGLVLLTAAK